MGRWLIGVAVSVVTVTAIAGAAQVRAIDLEGLLAGRFGFTSAEVTQARSGQAVAKLLPTQDAGEVGVFGAVRVDAKADRLVAWIEDVASFRKAAQLGFSRRLSDPPQIGDFADLSLDAGELSALRACRPGNCDLRLGDKAIARVQAEVDWAAPDSAQRANGLIRQLLFGHAQAYLAGRHQVLGQARRIRQRRVLVHAFERDRADDAELRHRVSPAGFCGPVLRVCDADPARRRRRT